MIINPTSTNIEPMMDKSNVELIDQFISKGSICIEWGIGGTTIYFAPMVKKWYGIDHTPEWFHAWKDFINQNRDKIQNYKFHKNHSEKFLNRWQNFKNHNLTYNNVKLFLKKLGPEYLSVPDYLDVENFDIVLIDGRKRVECSKYILNYINKKSTVFISDIVRC